MVHKESWQKAGEAAIRVCSDATMTRDKMHYELDWISPIPFASPDSSNDRLDGGQQVLHWDIAVTALLIEAVLPGRIGVRCSGERIQQRSAIEMLFIAKISVRQIALS